MEWAQVVWVWLFNEIVGFGVRWVGIVVLGVLLIGPRYRRMNRDLAALKKEIRAMGGRGPTVHTAIHNHAPVVSDPPSLGDIDEIRSMSQSEYDALPVKKEKTMYLIKSRD